MAKQSALDRAIQNLDEKIAALQLARAHLVEQQKAKPVRTKPRRVEAQTA
jgi:hypothetical protein